MSTAASLAEEPRSRATKLATTTLPPLRPPTTLAKALKEDTRPVRPRPCFQRESPGARSAPDNFETMDNPPLRLRDWGSSPAHKDDAPRSFSWTSASRQADHLDSPASPSSSQRSSKCFKRPLHSTAPVSPAPTSTALARPPYNDAKKGTSWTRHAAALDAAKPSSPSARPPPHTRARCTGVSTTSRAQQRGASLPSTPTTKPKNFLPSKTEPSAISWATRLPPPNQTTPPGAAPKVANSTLPKRAQPRRESVPFLSSSPYRQRPSNLLTRYVPERLVHAQVGGIRARPPEIDTA